MTQFETELRDKLLARLKIDHVDPATIGLETELFGGGLGLDSLDVLEVSVLVEQEYGISIAVAERGEAVFGSFGTLARFVAANLNRDRPKK